MPFADELGGAGTPEMKSPPGTFEYDGGPRVPLPMPKAGESATPRYEHRPRAANELQVSATAPPRRWVYPAYGEKAYREP